MNTAVARLALIVAAGFFPLSVLAAVPLGLVDDREASFIKPPQSSAPVQDEKKTQKPSLAAPKAAPEKPLIEPPPFAPPKKEEATIIQAPTATEILAPEKPKPVDLGEPVQAAAIPDVPTESLGLLSEANGGLGASMWKNTSRHLIDRLMPALGFPNFSPTLNDLARRFLLSIAAVPAPDEKDPKPLRDMMSLRIEKLLALGRVGDAWELAALVKPEKIDEITLRLLIEAALLKNEGKDLCAGIPKFVASFAKPDGSGAEWQKSLILCQLRAGDKKAAGLGLDLLREQGVKEDPFSEIVKKNAFDGSKKPPANLTPLRPLNLALLRLMDVALPAELFERPSAALIPELVRSRAVDDGARLDLAERAAAAGLVSQAQLSDALKSVASSPDGSKDPTGSRARALSFVAAFAEKDPAARIAHVQKIEERLPDGALTGAWGALLAALIDDVPAVNEYGFFAAQAARIFASIGRSDKALPWLTLARTLAPSFAEVGAQLAAAWPVFVLSGLVADGEFASGMKDWLFVALAPVNDADKTRARRDYAGQVLLILSAAGYAVPEDAWMRVIEALPVRRDYAPSPLLDMRLMRAAKDGRKGETILLGLLLAGGDARQPPVAASASIVRALHMIGLEGEAQGIAREAVAHMEMP